MITSTHTARALFASVSVLATLLSTAAAAGPPSPPSSQTGGVAQCQLERIGTQYVRCDNLTGLGGAAPVWVPEQS